MTWTHAHAWTFAALTEPTQLRVWFAEQVEVETMEGGGYRPKAAERNKPYN